MNPTFVLVASITAKLCRVLVEKMAKKCQFFTFFGVTRINFLGSRWNISTNEPVLERLLNFWIFGTYFRLIAHLVRAREPPKVKKSKIRVTRKPDLETQNWVYSFSSFIELYQTYIVTVQMLSTFFHLLDRVMVRTVMTLLTYSNGENRTNRKVSLTLACNSSDPFQTSHGILGITTKNHKIPLKLLEFLWNSCREKIARRSWSERSWDRCHTHRIHNIHIKN